jgi:hypothetical protein
MYKIYDIDCIQVKPYVKQKWDAVCEIAAVEMYRKNPRLQIEEISLEQFREVKTFFGNTVGEIFSQIGGSELKMRVPKNDYVIIKK